MLNFDHELRKIKMAVRSRRMFEGQAQYEVQKLHALARKHGIAWESDAYLSPVPPTAEMIMEDVKQLYELHREQKLADKYFLRDNAKILALCEELKIPFPGSKIIADGLRVNFISSVITEQEEEEEDEEEDEDYVGNYAELEFGNIYADEGGEEAEPVVNSEVFLQGVAIQNVTIASEETLLLSYNDGTTINLEDDEEEFCQRLMELLPQLRVKVEQFIQKHPELDFQVPEASTSIHFGGRELSLAAATEAVAAGETVTIKTQCGESRFEGSLKQAGDASQRYLMMSIQTSRWTTESVKDAVSEIKRLVRNDYLSKIRNGYMVAATLDLLKAIDTNADITETIYALNSWMINM